MEEKRMSTGLTEDALAAAMTALLQIEAVLPGLVALDDEERDGLMPLAPRAHRFARRVFVVLGRNPGVLPPGFDLAGARADMLALERLRPILARFQTLTARMEDTVSLLGDEVMVMAMEGYAHASLSGVAPELEVLRREMHWSFGASGPGNDTMA